MLSRLAPARGSSSREASPACDINGTCCACAESLHFGVGLRRFYQQLQHKNDTNVSIRIIGNSVARFNNYLAARVFVAGLQHHFPEATFAFPQYTPHRTKAQVNSVAVAIAVVIAIVVPVVIAIEVAVIAIVSTIVVAVALKVARLSIFLSLSFSLSLFLVLGLVNR